MPNIINFYRKYKSGKTIQILCKINFINIQLRRQRKSNIVVIEMQETQYFMKKYEVIKPMYLNYLAIFFITFSNKPYNLAYASKNLLESSKNKFGIKKY